MEMLPVYQRSYGTFLGTILFIQYESSNQGREVIYFYPISLQVKLDQGPPAVGGISISLLENNNIHH